MSSKSRIKVYLLKNYVESQEFLKEGTSKVFDKVSMNGNDVFLYNSKKSIPRWYKNFLLGSEDKYINSSSSGYMVKQINYAEEQYNFVISFGGADQAFESSKFVDDFGIKICLNVVDKFSSISKNNISTTMSNNKEVSTKKDEFGSFVFNVETDLIKGVSVKAIENNGITDGTLSGSSSLSISTDSNINDVEEMLIKLIEIYKSDNYKQRFQFIDNIKAIKNKELEKRIQENAYELLKNKSFEKVWFGSPDFDSWEKVSYFRVEYGKIKEEYADLYVEEIVNDFPIESYDTLNKIKVFPIYDEDDNGDVVRLSECLYGEVNIDGDSYIINNSNYYLISRDYVNEINEQYDKIEIIGSLPMKESKMSENKYNEFVSKHNKNFKLFDCKLFSKKSNSLELCDLYDYNNNMFIHVKKYGASSLLSHLFFQALNSAKYFRSNKKEIIDYYKEKFDLEVPDVDKYKVAMAIIAKTEVKDKKIPIPFFSKMSVVSTITELKSMGYDAGMIFVSSKI